MRVGQSAEGCAQGGAKAKGPPPGELQFDGNVGGVTRVNEEFDLRIRHDTNPRLRLWL